MAGSHRADNASPFVRRICIFKRRPTVWQARGFTARTLRFQLPTRRILLPLRRILPILQDNEFPFFFFFTADSKLELLSNRFSSRNDLEEEKEEVTAMGDG